jgi:hypothetical protein
VLDCKVRCESQTNCVGFQFTYGLNVVNQNQTFSCFPILLADANGCNVAKGGDLKDGRKGNRYQAKPVCVSPVLERIHPTLACANESFSHPLDFFIPHCD